MSDLIRREDVENTIQRLCDLCGEYEKYNGVMCGACNLDNFIRVLDDIPSAEPKWKNGYWVPVTNGRGGFECDQCHNYAPSYQNGDEYLSHYCPNCGAEMTRGEYE